MIETTLAPADPADPSYALSAAGLLADFNAAGVLHAADVHAATRIAGLVGERSETARLALALTIRALRHGSVCLDLLQVREQLGELHTDAGDLAWPEADQWVAELAVSPLVAGADRSVARPLRLVHGLLYLDTYWRQEELVARQVDRRMSGADWVVADAAALAAAVPRILSGEHEGRQRVAAAVAAHRGLVILAGGPGTGKTTAVARILAVLADQPGPPPRIALAAPTGKAAARLGEAVTAAIGEMLPGDRARLGQLKGVTVHRLLGARPGHTLRYNAFNRLGHDIVVVDEASMLSLTAMADLLAAVRDDARVILVGDPDQLESVDAGVVLADLVERAGRRALADPGSPDGGDAITGGWSSSDLAAFDPPSRALAGAGVVTLTHRFRFGDQHEIVALAEAIVAGEPDRVLEVVRSATEQVRFLEIPDSDPADSGQDAADPGGAPRVDDPGVALWSALADGELEPVRADAVAALSGGYEAALAGDCAGALEALGRHQLLCAHRHGSFGASVWTRQVEQWGRDAVPGYASGAQWYPGRPVMARVNDVELGIFNGDVGMVVRAQGATRVAFGTPERPVLVNPTRLADVDTVHALTIHKSQGSQYEGVTLILPPLGSPLLARGLLYTAVTRARRRVTIVGGEHALRAAVARPVARASGLREV